MKSVPMIAAVAFALGIGGPPVSFALAGEVLIAHPSVGVKAIDADTVKNLFLGKSTKIGNSRVTIVTQANGKTHDEFLRNFLGKTSEQFRNFWRKEAFTGKASLPLALDDDDSVAKWVAANAGTIGYVSDKTPLSGVSVIQVQ